MFPVGDGKNSGFVIFERHFGQRIERPDGYAFVPGQATDVAIDQDGWRDEKRPFTFTGLRQWRDLEFTIKIYSDHDGVTSRLATLQEGDTLLIYGTDGALWQQITITRP